MAANLCVRRQGNVLTATDWEPAPEPATLITNVQPAVENFAIRRGRSTVAYAAAGILSIGVASIGRFIEDRQQTKDSRHISE